MSSLKIAIQDVLKMQHHKVSLPENPPALSSAYMHVKQILGEGAPIEPLTNHDCAHWVCIAREMLAAGKLGDLGARDLKSIALSLWYDEHGRLADDQLFLQKYLDVCQAIIKKSLCGVLVWVYIYNYAQHSVGTRMIGEWLSKIVLKWDWLWADRQKDFKLFSGDDDVRLIGQDIISKRQVIQNSLEQYGFRGALQSSGLVSVAFGEALEIYKNKASTKVYEDVVIDLRLILDWASLGSNKFSYPEMKTNFINALLLPWDGIVADELIINTTQSYLIDFFGDPRRGGASWSCVDENALRVIRGWLVKRALAQFLDVVDELALEEHWRYRRAFWMAYYMKGVISDAWVVFAARGAEKAKQIARRKNDNSWLSFGKLDGAYENSHAVLVLRIGDITIADFSHNGKCRLWGRGNNSAPKPYEKIYERSALMDGTADSEHIHSNSSGYFWQMSVAAKIKELTGISLVHGDYIP